MAFNVLGRSAAAGSRGRRLRRLPIVALTLVVAAQTSACAGSGEAKPAAGSAKAPALGALGANFNQNLDAVDYRELNEAGVKWLRGFFPMPAADQGAPGKNVAIRTILDASKRGHGTILSLKFPYNKTSFPKAGSPQMKAELARVDKVLPLVLGKVDIVAIGNEPFIESKAGERDKRLNAFYETVAKHVIDVRRKRCGANCKTSLYMGALNHIDQPSQRTPAVERWMAFVRKTPAIRGVDIHPHVAAPQNAKAYVNYILPRMRKDQRFLVTEFSLTPFWRKHMTDVAPASFTKKYGFAKGTKVWQVIKAAINKPFTERKWADFLAASPWFANNASFLRDQMRLYRGTGRLAVATYAFKQDDLMVKNWGPKKDPWLINSVYARYTVQSRGQLSGRSPWFRDFKALQAH
ncbi:hypothetical protein J4573_15670 [Actinomadura barringtoniae]|uniref:Uncharacterized protein n=1 Tax=Actinomadura barringtoniae TaxID=1427535 RepID=A0A939P9L4_9ACTN|nr:hypothetical protein [Actinomadura barringtoniae]MBO2448541.1 hypothetical protein [Actinomadura barringtoniae]